MPACFTAPKGHTTRLCCLDVCSAPYSARTDTMTESHVGSLLEHLTLHESSETVRSDSSAQVC